MNKTLLRLSSFVLVFCVLCGLFVSPHTYLANTTSKSYICTENDIVVVPYSFRTGYFDTTVSNATIDTDCLRFRLWVYFGESIPKGSKVNVSLDLRSGVGAIGKVEGFFALPNGQDIYAQESLSSKLEIDYFGNGRLSPFVGTFELTGDASAFVVDVTYTSRTSTSIYLNVSNITLDCVIPDVVYEELKDLNTSSNSILDNVKNMFTSLANLPSNIKTQLSTLFTNIVNSVNNVKTVVDSLLTGQTTLGDLFESAIIALGNTINDKMSDLFDLLPNSIKLDLQPLFLGITDGVNNAVDSIINLPSNLSSFFTSLGDKLSELISLFTRDSGGGGGHTIDANPLEQATNDLRELRENLSSDSAGNAIDDLDSYIPTDEHLLLRVYSLIFENHLILSSVYLSLIFGVIAYVLFGKR